MCKYCDELFTGDYGDDLSSVDVEVNDIKLLGLQTWLSDSKGKVYLRTDLIDGVAQTLAHSEIEIQYCPICGRKFMKEES